MYLLFCAHMINISYILGLLALDILPINLICVICDTTIPSCSNFVRYYCSQIDHVHHIFCAQKIIFLRVLNIIRSTPPLECLHCLLFCNSNRFHFFIFKFYIMIVHTLKMCTYDAGPEQSLVLLTRRACST